MQAMDGCLSGACVANASNISLVSWVICSSGISAETMVSLKYRLILSELTIHDSTGIKHHKKGRCSRRCHNLTLPGSIIPNLAEAIGFRVSPATASKVVIGRCIDASTTCFTFDQS